MTDVTERRSEVSVLTPADLVQGAWSSLHNDDLIDNLTLWRAGASVIGLLRLHAGADHHGHVHPTSSQHAWVIEGRFSIEGTEIGPGSYVCMPAGTAHRIATVGSEPCTLFFVYQPFAADHDHHH
jgi:mannose-6-phosphate isomerase-like protein (cupin superfamily)